MKGSYLEVVIGFLTLMICAFVIYFSLYHGYLTLTNNPQYTINAEFDTIEGVKLGTEVKLSGVVIGKVSKISLTNKNYNANIAMSIDSNIRLPEDTSAQIATNGFIGDKYINLMPGIEEEILQENSHIERTQSSINLEKLLGKFVFSKK